MRQRILTLVLGVKSTCTAAWHLMILDFVLCGMLAVDYDRVVFPRIIRISNMSLPQLIVIVGKYRNLPFSGIEVVGECRTLSIYIVEIEL